jgi:hypothetical protein
LEANAWIHSLSSTVIFTNHSLMSTSIEPLDEKTSNTLTASVLYPDVASIVQAFVQNAIKNSPKSHIEVRIDFAPSWQINCRNDGNCDRSIEDDSIQKLSFLGTLCTDTCGERTTRKVRKGLLSLYLLVKLSNLAKISQTIFSGRT